MTKSMRGIFLAFAAVTFCASDLFGAEQAMTVRQKSIELEFQVYRTPDMPANWFKTYDEYFVTKRIDNNWVYGIRTTEGMKRTGILVGSIDPAEVPELNEAYTYVSEGARPLYIPPLPQVIMPSSTPSAVSETSTLSSMPSAVSEPSTLSSMPSVVSETSTLSSTPSVVSEPSTVSSTPLVVSEPSTVSSTPLVVSEPSTLSSKPPATSLTPVNIDVFRLSENGTLKELREALKEGADFNVSRNGFSMSDDINSDSWSLYYDYGITPLHHAAAFNHEPLSLRFIISQGLDVNAEAYSGAAGRVSDTPLSLAIRHKNSRAVSILLESGADADSYCGDGLPVNMFLLASRLNNKGVAKSVISMLKKAGGNINLHDEADSDLRSSIMLEDVNGLSEADKEALERTRTALISAVIDDDPDSVNILLDAGADVSVRDGAGKTALDYARELSQSSKLRKSKAFTRLQKVHSSNGK